MFDAFDIMLLSMLAVPIMKALHLTAAQCALVFSLQLAAAALGGILMGTLADYIGRRRAMMVNILVYSVSTGLIFFAHSLATLLVLRFFTGLGLGGEWGLGKTQTAERIPPAYWGRDVALGNIGWPFGTLLAAVFAYFIDPALGWRATFALAAFPALLVLWVRTFVPESTLWRETRKARHEEKWQKALKRIGHVGHGIVNHTMLT